MFSRQQSRIACVAGALAQCWCNCHHFRLGDLGVRLSGGGARGYFVRGLGVEWAFLRKGERRLGFACGAFDVLCYIQPKIVREGAGRTAVFNGEAFLLWVVCHGRVLYALYSACFFPEVDGSTLPSLIKVEWFSPKFVWRQDLRNCT